MTGATPNPDRALAPLATRCTYNGTAWSAPSVVSRERQLLPVASAGVQYGFSVLEGLKAYRQCSGGSALFQVEQHAHRLQQGAARLGLTEVPRALFKETCEVATEAHADLLSPSGGGGLYLRPLLVAPDEHLGVSIPQTAELVISTMTCADWPPTAKRLWVETEMELSLSELLRGGRAGAIGECFLTGTLSRITPVAAIQVGGLTLKPRPGRAASLVGERLSAWHRGEATP